METNNPLLNRSVFSGYGQDQMTATGTINKTGILMLLCLFSAAYGWTHPVNSWAILVPVLGAFVLCIIAAFKPSFSPIAAPLYAILEGFALGCISVFTNVKYPGVAFNAVFATLGVLTAMIILYHTRIIKVTPGFKSVLSIMLMGIAIFYILTMGLSFFGIHVPLVYGNSLWSIGFSVIVCGVASFYLLVDFDNIEQHVNDGSPKYLEWYCALSLLITIVWLYLEILRLFSKLRSRD
jgi:uncharacterized YccA/Bax inhibitor family protein